MSKESITSWLKNACLSEAKDCFCIIPRRCAYTKQIMWLKSAIKVNFFPDEVYFMFGEREIKYFDKKEFLFLRLKI